jgi:hypothetical protein
VDAPAVQRFGAKTQTHSPDEDPLLHEELCETNRIERLETTVAAIGRSRHCDSLVAITEMHELKREEKDAQCALDDDHSLLLGEHDQLH